MARPRRRRRKASSTLAPRAVTPSQIPDGDRELATLAELRRSVKLTQVQLAQRIGISQRAVSHVEHEPNPRVATLATHIRALGGQLQLRAAFGERVVELDLIGSRPAAADDERRPAAGVDRPDDSTP